MKSIPMKPFDINLEARGMLDKRLKTLLLFFGLNMVCLSVSLTNKPHLWFWFLVVGCYLVYEWQKKQKDFQAPDSMLTQRFSHRSSSHGDAEKDNT
ncbi:hypothetical protein HMPREF1400_00860 [Helicobacter pylori GAM119Bi]|nr:hypothetical protein HMPREF1400_00860 [Helicobacter pylori GAM119Bi]EMG96810.1 hypothetical protein HMPREF1402_01479 [Helicobacter pylori GAM121Aii]